MGTHIEVVSGELGGRRPELVSTYDKYVEVLIVTSRGMTINVRIEADGTGEVDLGGKHSVRIS
jgi:hypothetical protein